LPEGIVKDMKLVLLTILSLASIANAGMQRIWDTRVANPIEPGIAGGVPIVHQSIRVPVVSALTSIDLGVWPASARPMLIGWTLQRDGVVLERDAMTVTDLPLVHPFTIRFDFPAVFLLAGDRLILTEYSFGFNSRPWVSERMGLVSAGYGDYGRAAEVPEPSAFVMGSGGMALLLSRRRR
jgi:hypothetical protein